MTQWHTPDTEINLPDEHIHIWLSYLNLHEARLKHLYPLLSAEEKERSERFKYYKHRKLFIASHGFMRSVLSMYINTPPEQIEYSLRAEGKPKLVLQAGQTDIRFNLSHSGNLALLAIRRSREVGVDIEHMEKRIEWKKIIKRFYTEAEQNAIFALPEDQQQAAFFQVWTRKEAHMKVTGQGLHLSPSSFSVSVPPEAARFIEYINESNEDNWYMQDIELPETFKDYAACMSTDNHYSDITHFVFK